ncbi:MAG TPA: DUF4824 family protein [Vicinamibacterales bacterium]|nr:DUF4824 family protein [Vicinamibacterales bacterium]
MTRKAPWMAAAVLLVSNLAVLAGAGWNRRAEPEAVLELTERELRLPPSVAENTALALSLTWVDPGGGRRIEPGQQVIAWFDRTKLEAIGFDCRAPLNTESVVRYRSLPSRRTYAVLEYDGDAWRRLAPAAAGPARGGSRLVVVDAGNDAGELRRRWPDRTRTVVVPAAAGVAVDEAPDGRLTLRGRILQVFPMQLNVPRGLRGPLEPLQQRRADQPAPEAGHEPRYRVRVHWGREAPWIMDVRATREGG